MLVLSQRLFQKLAELGFVVDEEDVQAQRDLSVSLYPDSAI
jgi:hypothetical protein